jgi:hypothetical protein
MELSGWIRSRGREPAAGGAGLPNELRYYSISSSARSVGVQKGRVLSQFLMTSSNLVNAQVGRPLTLKNSARVNAGLPACIREIGSVAH